MKKIILLTVFLNIVYSQTVMIPSSVGTAGTIATQARGDDVIGWNPANLGFEDNPEFSMSFGVIPIIPIPAINIVNSSVSMNWLADYIFSGQYLDNTLKAKMLEDFGKDGWDINPLVYVKILGISSGNFAFSIGAEINSNIKLPTSLLNFAMNGNIFGEVISLVDTDGSTQAIVPFSLSYGFPLELPDLDLNLGNNYLGVGVKLLWGVGNAEVEYINGGLVTYKDYVDGTGKGLAKYSYDGFGLAFDLGWALKIGDNITTNLSVQNLFGFIKWNDKNTEFVEFTFEGEVKASDNFDDIADVFSGTDSTYSAKGYTSDYPTYLVAGFEYDVNSKINLFINYKQYFSDEFQFTTDPRFSIGTKLSPAKWFPIRLGFAAGGFEKIQVGTGFGIHTKHYHFDIGLSQTGGFFNSARGLGIAIGQKILF